MKHEHFVILTIATIVSWCKFHVLNSLFTPFTTSIKRKKSSLEKGDQIKHFRKIFEKSKVKVGAKY